MVRRRAFFFFLPGFLLWRGKKEGEGEKKGERREEEEEREREKSLFRTLLLFLRWRYSPLPNQTKTSFFFKENKKKRSFFVSKRKGERGRETRRRTRREGERNEKKNKERGKARSEGRRGEKNQKNSLFPLPPPLSPEKLKALSGGTSGCCGNSTQIIVTPGVRDSRNSTVSYVPKSAEDCHLRCAADSTCLTASVFSNKGNLFCNLFAASTCRYSRLQCNPTDSDAPTFVVHGSWLFPCRSPKGGISEDDTALCTTGHGHGVDGWHEGHGVFVSGGNGGGGHNHG